MKFQFNDCFFLQASWKGIEKSVKSVANLSSSAIASITEVRSPQSGRLGNPFDVVKAELQRWFVFELFPAFLSGEKVIFCFFFPPFFSKKKNKKRRVEMKEVRNMERLQIALG